MRERERERERECCLAFSLSVICKRRLWVKRKLCNGRAIHFFAISLSLSSSLALSLSLSLSINISLQHARTHALYLSHSHSLSLSLSWRPDVVLRIFRSKRLWMLRNKKNNKKWKERDDFLFVLRSKRLKWKKLQLSACKSVKAYFYEVVGKE